MKQIYSFILLFPLLLVSCGEGNINPSTSSSEESYKLIVNCPGHENESYENKSGDDLNPSIHLSRIIILMAGMIKKMEES